ncbi:MAG: hypothetical protein R3B53_03680 [Candidatus Paceibacterota bacterium]
MSNKTPRHQRNRVATRPTHVATAVSSLMDMPATSPALTLIESSGPTDASPVLKDEGKANVPPLVIDCKQSYLTKEHVRQVYDHLRRQPDIELGCLWHTLPGSLAARFEGVAVTNEPYIQLVMKELGLIRFTGWSRGVNWQIIDESFFEEVVTARWFEQAIRNAMKWETMVNNLRLAKERVTELETASSAEVQSLVSSGTANDEPDPALMVQIAGLIEEINTLRAEMEDVSTLRTRCVESAATIADLERKLAEKPKVTAADVAGYLASFRAGKA